MSNAQKEAISKYVSARGLVHLPDSAYGPHVKYLMVRVPGRKTPIRILVSA